jgi:integrase
MAIEKVGIYRKYSGSVPKNASGHPLPKAQWKDKRPFSWAARWFGTDGRRYSRSFSTRKEAERFAEAKQAEVRVGQGDPPKHCTLKEFYLEHRKLSVGGVARMTLVMQLATLRLFAKHIGWNRHIGKIRSKEIEAFRAWRSPQVGSGWTLRKEIKQLKRLFNLAIERGYVPKGMNPCDTVTVKKPGNKRPNFMPPAQFEQVFAQATNLLARVLLVVLYTVGLRRREALCLTWDDVDFDEGILHVAARKKQGYVQSFTPKDHERREVPMPQQAIDLLKEWRKLAPRGCPYIFMDAGRWEYYRDCVDRGEWSEHQHLVNNSLRKFQTLCKLARIKKFSLHDLRRSCITNWARNGVPMHVAQEYAGHADINTTREFYLSVQRDDQDAVRAAQQKVVSGISQLKLTDPKVTQTAPKRYFPKRRIFADGMQLPEESRVA